jgi:RimJ/RimL family protein N-acetyltransferase
VNIPVLETERLILRAHRREDFEFFARLGADPDVVRYLGEPLSRDEAWKKFLRAVGHWHITGYGFWAVEEKTRGRLIGEAGFVERQRESADPLAGLPEIGWVLAKSAWGKGFATEAARAALKWGWEHFGSVRAICVVSPGNRASIRVAEKCGFKELLRDGEGDEARVVFDRML